MRILIISDKLTGGAGNVAQQLSSHFSMIEGNTVFLMLDATAKPKYDLSRVHVLDRKMNPVQLRNPIKKIIRYVKNIKKKRKLIDDCHADVIVSFLNSVSMDVLIAQWFTKIPIIVSERSNPYQEWEDNSLFMNFKWWISYHRANMIVYQFHCFEPFFKFAHRRNKTCAIPNMIYDMCEKPMVRQISDSQPVRFASVATLRSVKRIDIMIGIVAKVHKHYPNIYLNIYGEGPDGVDLQKQVDDLGLQEIVCFHGHTTEIKNIMEHNDILLMTSEREGFPNVILEAMNVSVPTVTFRCHEGFSEIIQDGVNGFLIKQNDIKAFVEKLEYIIRRPEIITMMSKESIASREKYNKEYVMNLWSHCIGTTIKNHV